MLATEIDFSAIGGDYGVMRLSRPITIHEVAEIARPLGQGEPMVTLSKDGIARVSFPTEYTPEFPWLAQ
jgi:hypothetical protein